VTRTAAIIVAGGTGERFGRVGGKQLVRVLGATVLGHALGAFERCDAIDEIVVVVHPDRVGEYAVEMAGILKVTGIVGGGDTRQESVAAGLAALSSDVDLVVVHDGARPLVTPRIVAEAIEYLGTSGADGVVVGHPAYDTIKRVSADGAILATEDRSTLWVAQTPQAFRAASLRRAYTRAEEEGFVGTDDSSLVERLGGRVIMLLGPRDNLKVTVPEDLPVVERLLEARAEES
jgi:2-C-methyl-D-erythritol 4-phosphate cytidylyltransferase